jgi:hypothetical protein
MGRLTASLVRVWSRQAAARLDLAALECREKLNGKAQVEWYGHLNTIDEPAALKQPGPRRRGQF